MKMIEYNPVTKKTDYLIQPVSYCFPWNII